MNPKNTRILIVDDEEPIRSSLANFLEDYDFQVQTAASAEEGLSLLNDSEFDLGIIDLRLPGISGDMMILKAHNLCPQMRFLIHTGSMNYSLGDELQQIGLAPENVLYKPQPNLGLFLEYIGQILD